jgi:dihydrofolate reductase
VSRLKERQGGDIVVTGSISLVHALNQTDLVDEYRLFVYPVVVGSGRRLFDGPLKRRLDLLDTQAVSSGVVLLRYRTA